MKPKIPFILALACLIALFLLGSWASSGETGASAVVKAPPAGRFMYVAVPGIRNYLGYGGHGILVFDMDNDHKFVKRIPMGGLGTNGKPLNVKGIAVSVPLNSLFVSTTQTLQRIDLTSEKVLWEKPYEGGADRMSISPDGKTMYLPSFEKSFWHVIDCGSGEVIKKIEVVRRAHNTLYGPSGNQVYLGDLSSHWLHVADPKTHTIAKQVGPFSSNVRPFTVNAAETLAFVTVDSLLGFQVGDLKTGKVLNRLVVEGWEMGPVRRHGNPSHGIALTPDEKEIWLADGHNMRMHVFSGSSPYQQLTTIPLQDMPGWITFSMDGKYAYPSSGEVIEAKTRKILLTLQDEFYNNVASEKMVEIHLQNHRVAKAGDQFGIGRAKLAVH